MRPIPEQTILITGATDGLGRHLAGRLAEAGATVVVHGRDPARVERVRSEIRAATGAERTHGVLADLADLRRVDGLATEILDRFPRLDALVNNAGLGSGGSGARREVSADGIESRFAVNYLAGYHLTRRLLPRLVESAPARVVNVSSAGQEAIDFDDPMLERAFDGGRAYRQSKLAQILLTVDLADELAAVGADVTVNALHPATLMPTTMVLQGGRPVMSTLDEGGEATLRLITDPALDAVSGRYFDRAREVRADDQAYDAEARSALRRLSDGLIARALGPA